MFPLNVAALYISSTFLFNLFFPQIDVFMHNEYKILNIHLKTNPMIINRPGVARAVLQTPL